VAARAYIETSVIGHYVSRTSRDLRIASHQEATIEWWQRVLPTLDPFVSPIVEAEVSAGDPGEAGKRLAAIADMNVLPVTREVSMLAQEYFRALSIPKRAMADMLHLALAAHHGMDFLITWNCQHIANERVRGLIRRTNDQRGIDTPAICTPEEMLEMTDAQGPDH